MGQPKELEEGEERKELLLSSFWDEERRQTPSQSIIGLGQEDSVGIKGPMSVWKSRAGTCMVQE